MKKNTKIILISGGVIALALGVWYVVKNKKNKSMGSGSHGDFDNPKAVFNSLKDEFKFDNEKLELLNVAERIYRHESANFTSNIYQKTKGAGVIAVNNSYPYGWVSPQSTWENYGKPKSLYSSPNGNSYIIFPNLKVGVRTVMAIIDKYYKDGYDASRYFSVNPSNYIDLITAIPEDNLYTESFLNNPFLQKK